MIEVKNLTKNYGTVTAVKNVNLSISKGEIVGFLGPNGAGKSTTLKVLAGYLPQTSGDVSLLNLSNKENPLEIKKNIGYLAENNPIYESMEVSEYLSFVWEARSLGDREKRETRIREVVKACSLENVIGKDISELSRGYRQRVGLAASIIHDPAILLLDEPTSGLDPIQSREVRALIKSIKQEKTILLSTHILSEVQAICDRVIVIHKGSLVADRKVSEIDTNKNEFLLTVSFRKEQANGIDLRSIEGVMEAEGPIDSETNNEITYNLKSSKDIRFDVFKAAARNNWPLVELKAEKRSLEEVFHDLTKE
ncbi:ATP-binding cassette domain-containing protein [Elusimicrobiota bacterium]